MAASGVRQALDLLVRSGKEWAQDQAPRQAAALAYYALFALGPVLLIAVGLAGLVFGPEAADEAVTGEFERLVGPEAAEAVRDLMDARRDREAGAASLAVGGVALLFGAAGVFAQLRASLNLVWEIEERPAQGWKAKLVRAVRRNFLGATAVLGIGFLLLVSLAVSAGLSAVAERAEGLVPGPEAVWFAVNLLFSTAMVAVLFALMFKFLPDARVAWRDVVVGAVVTALLFVAGEAAIGAYLGQAATATKYGAAGAVLVLLLWVYYSGLILLYGAELTQVYANTHGAHIRPSRRAQPIQEAVAERHQSPQREGTKRNDKRGTGAGRA